MIVVLPWKGVEVRGIVEVPAVILLSLGWTVSEKPRRESPYRENDTLSHSHWGSLEYGKHTDE